MSRNSFVVDLPLRAGRVCRVHPELLNVHENGPGLVGPQDGIEPMRRMRKWIVSERPLPHVKPLWELAEGESALVA